MDLVELLVLAPLRQWLTGILIVASMAVILVATGWVMRNCARLARLPYKADFEQFWLRAVAIWLVAIIGATVVLVSVLVPR